MILDTAGRSQLDSELMEELHAIHQRVNPAEMLLVVDAMIGQESVNIAKGFKQEIPLTGLFLTKIEGDARGGAAISIRSVTGVPIKFLGTGEILEAIEVFDPVRLANRILGMGDVIGLIEKAEAAYDEKTSRDQAEKLMAGEFSLDDFADQLKQVARWDRSGKSWICFREDWAGSSQNPATGCREPAEADRGDHQFDDQSRTASTRYPECLQETANSPGIGN